MLQFLVHFRNAILFILSTEKVFVEAIDHKTVFSQQFIYLTINFSQLFSFLNCPLVVSPFLKTKHYVGFYTHTITIFIYKY